MKKRLSVLAIAIACFMGVAMAEYREFSMGSVNKILQYTATGEKDFIVFIYQNVNGNPQVVGRYIGNVEFTNKTSLDSYAVENIREAADGAITNDFGQNRNLPFLIYATLSRYDRDLNIPINYMGIRGSFSLIKKQDGSYVLPDLSWLKTDFPSEIAYKIVGLKWARIEVTDVSGSIISTFDSAISDSETIDIKGKFLFIPTEWALSGRTGSTRIKISLLTTSRNVELPDTFQVYGPDGLPIEEISPGIKLNTYAGANAKPANVVTTMSIGSSGGEVGRTYVFQTADNPEGPWTDIPGSRYCTSSQFEKHQLLWETTKERNFFRTSTVEGVMPDYTK